MSVEEGDVINVTCRAYSRGNLRHVCSCDSVMARQEIAMITESDGQFTHSDLFTAGLNLHGRNITCQFGFQSTTEFNYEWNSQPINVLCEYHHQPISVQQAYFILGIDHEFNNQLQSAQCSQREHQQM